MSIGEHKENDRMANSDFVNAIIEGHLMGQEDFQKEVLEKSATVYQALLCMKSQESRAMYLVALCFFNLNQNFGVAKEEYLDAFSKSLRIKIDGMEKDIESGRAIVEKTTLKTSAEELS